jgi:hypothetical protein
VLRCVSPPPNVNIDDKSSPYQQEQDNYQVHQQQMSIPNAVSRASGETFSLLAESSPETEQVPGKQSLTHALSPSLLETHYTSASVRPSQNRITNVDYVSGRSTNRLSKYPMGKGFVINTVMRLLNVQFVVIQRDFI